MSLRSDFELLTLDDSEKWVKYLRMLPIEQQDVYYTPEYYRLYEELGDGSAKCYVFKKNHDLALYPFLINAVNNLWYDLADNYFDIQGAYGYNGVISSTQDQDFINDFYQSFELFCQKENIIAEFTRFHPLIKNKSFSENHINVYFDRKTMYVNLQNKYENIFNDFQTTTRKQIKRAINRHQIEVRLYENETSILEDFWYIYNEAMNRVKAVPYLYFNKSYFKSLIENTRNACFLAYYKNKPVAAIIAIYDNCFIHGHLGGTLTDYQHLSPFSLLYSEIIKFGQTKSCRYFHTGGGATNQPDDPVLKFKMNFSDLTGDFFIGKKIHHQTVYNEVVEQWKRKFPEKSDKHSNVLLKYRY